MLITLYGINNIGKSTQAHLLMERLKESGLPAVYVKYPVYSLEPTGPFLYDFLRSGEAQNMSEEALQMWFALNRYQFEESLKNWLAEGKIVLAEDYIGTGIAWGVSKGASLDWLESLNKNLIQEDEAFLLDGERFVHAVEESHLHETNDAFIKRARQVHLDLAQRYSWTVVPVQESKEATSEILWQAVKPHLKF